MTTTSLSATIVAPSPARKQVAVAIRPKPGLPPADCQRLGEAINTALPQLNATEDSSWNVMSAIADLLAGEQPKPLVLRVMTLYRLLQRESGERSLPVSPSDVTAEYKARFGNSPLAHLCDVPAAYLNLVVDADESDDTVSVRVLAALPSELVSEARLLHST